MHDKEDIFHTYKPVINKVEDELSQINALAITGMPQYSTVCATNKSVLERNCTLFIKAQKSPFYLVALVLPISELRSTRKQKLGAPIKIYGASIDNDVLHSLLVLVTL